VEVQRFFLRYIDDSDFPFSFDGHMDMPHADGDWFPEDAKATQRQCPMRYTQTEERYLDEESGI
jgi:hypothetical protein